MHFFRSRAAHTVFYLLLLAGWTFVNDNVRSCFSCTSSVMGLSYGLVYVPLAALLLIQAIWDTRAGWLLLSVFSAILGAVIITSSISFYNEYQGKMMITNKDVLVSQVMSTLLFLSIFAPYFVLLWVVRPRPVA